MSGPMTFQKKSRRERYTVRDDDGRGRRAPHGPLAVPETAACSLSLAPFRPRRQPLLAVSAPGGARRRCPARGFGAVVEKMEHPANPPLLQPFDCQQRRVDA